MMSAIKTTPLADIDIWRIHDGTHTSFEFRPITSMGQDWLEEELQLQGTGANVKKMVCNELDDARRTMRRMIDAGLEVYFGDVIAFALLNSKGDA
jgi:hypothetical protein